MEIEYKGANSLVIKVGSLNIVLNPKLSIYGQKDLKVDSAVELATESELAIEGNEKILITGPGEYEVSGVSIRGIAAQIYGENKSTDHTTIYKLDVAGYRLAVIGRIAPKLSEDQLESIGIVDILAVPVGGNNYTLDAHEAAGVTRQIDPKIVIPIHYHDSAISYQVAQNNPDDFLASLGANQHEVVDKLKLKPGAGLPEVLRVIELKRT